MYYDSFFGFGWIFMLVFWALIFWAIVSFVRGDRNYSHRHHDNEYDYEDHRALAIIKERYAKGELSKEKYEEMKKELSN